MGIKLTVTSKDGLGEVKGIVQEAIDFIDEHDVYVNNYGFKLVMFEALNNAIIHGNSKDSELQSECEVEIIDQMLTITVQNEGDGFDWRQVLADAESNDGSELIEGGRGFVIYKLYGYSFSFSEDGRKITLQKNLDLKS